MEIKEGFCITQYDSPCIEHSNNAGYALTLNYGGIIIPMCQTCIDELYEAILPPVSAGLRDKSE